MLFILVLFILCGAFGGSGANEGMGYKVSITGNAGFMWPARGVQVLAPCLGFLVCTGN